MREEAESGSMPRTKQARCGLGQHYQFPYGTGEVEYNEPGSLATRSSSGIPGICVKQFNQLYASDNKKSGAEEVVRTATRARLVQAQGETRS
jgi:hypothetical protein